MKAQQVEALDCRECKTRSVYYPEVHHLDGNRRNNLPSNLVLVCPNCNRHFLFRFNSDEIFILKMRGLSNAEIGRILGLSRERVRQIYERRKVELSRLPGEKLDNLVRLALGRQEELMDELEEKQLELKEELKFDEPSEKRRRKLESKLADIELRLKGRIEREEMKEIVLSRMSETRPEAGGKKKRGGKRI